MKNSWLIRFANGLYANGPVALRTALLLVYGAKCFASVCKTAESAPDLVFFASYPSEKRVLNRVSKDLHELNTEFMSISVWNCLKPQAFLSLFHYLRLSARLVRFARLLAVRHTFMPACRIFSVVPYYARAKYLLSSAPKAIFIASQYSPESLGFASAMHAYEKKVFFISHANATGKRQYVPPLHADLVGVSSQALADIYQKHSSKSLKFLYYPSGGDQGAMRGVRDRDKAIVVGIFLTGLTDEGRLEQLLRRFSVEAMFAHTFVRPHPVKLVHPQMDKISLSRSLFSMSRHSSLEDDIDRADLAVCGNSTVTTEILRAGKPVLYDSRLDNLPFDYNGYAEAGLVMEYPKVFDQSTLKRIEHFYSAEKWVRSMRFFDCGYQQNEQEIRAVFAEGVKRALGTGETTRQ